METSVPAIENWCNTESKLTRLRFRWTIDNFSCRFEEPGEALKSLPFSEGPNNEYLFHLLVYPKGLNRNSTQVSMFVYSDYCKKSDVGVKYRLSILNSKEEDTYISQSIVIPLSKGNIFGSDDYIRQDKLLNPASDLLPNDKLTLFCEVIIVHDTLTSAGQTNQIKVPESKLAKDFGNIFDHPKFCDVTIAIDDHQIRANKIILAARSSVFAAMFDHQMEEARSSCVFIKDIDYDVFMEMLRFMYTGESPNLEQMPDGLLAAADKYALEDLKVHCEEALRSNLTIETAAKTLILADLYSALQLKERTINFICSKATAVTETQGFKGMIINQPRLTLEVFQAFAKQNVSTSGHLTN